MDIAYFTPQAVSQTRTTSVTVAISKLPSVVISIVAIANHPFVCIRDINANFFWKGGGIVWHFNVSVP